MTDDFLPDPHSKTAEDPSIIDWRTATFEIVQDTLPVEWGGFRPGARFKLDHMRRMMSLGSISKQAIVIDLRNGKQSTIAEANIKPWRHDEKRSVKNV